MRNSTGLFNVRDFGAVGGGVALDQEAIQAAIDACSQDGGGQVYFPPGRYLTGTIQLRSNVCLHLEMGARIVASSDKTLFPEICKTPYGNLPGQIQALLYVDQAENVTVSGYGAIDGGGNSPLPPEEAAKVFFRPALVFFRDCRKVRFLDVSLEYSTFWTLHLLRCRDVMIRGCTILAHRERINTDGIDPDGCQDVIISDCRIDTGDDCIVVKSTEGDPCQNITISNCNLRSSHTALKLGTEAIGDIRNITFTNCVITDSNVALALFMKDGSTYENIIFSNMIVEASHDFPIVIDHTPRYYKEPRFGEVRNVVLENVLISGSGRCLLEGQASHPLQNITFRNLTWTITGACRYSGARKPPGARRIEPDPNAINYAGKRAQIIAVHVRGLTMDNCRIIHPNGAAEREPLFLHNVEDSVEPDVSTMRRA
jgi:hypothetical protein